MNIIPITLTLAEGLPAQNTQMWFVILAGMAIAPFLLMMVTSFTKLVIVGGLIRSALGTQQIPPNQVVVGLALVLSAYIMWPVAEEVFANYQSTTAAPSTVPAATPRSPGGDLPANEAITRAAAAMRDPMRRFLQKHSTPANVMLFESLQQQLRDSQQHIPNMVAPDGLQAGVESSASRFESLREFSVLVPAFVLTELTEAFWIGVLIFIPFLVVDLFVGNVLLAMGMHMMQPNTVALPLKILLFVVVGGWELIIRGVVLGYT